MKTMTMFPRRQLAKRRLDERHHLYDQQEQKDIPDPALVEELDRSGDEKEGEEAGDDGFIGHPQVVLVKPHGIIKPLSEIRFTPAGLLVEPA